VVRLLQRAKEAQDWDLCKELARFLMALDETGATLRKTLELVELKSPGVIEETPAFTFDMTRLNVPRRGRRRTNGGAVGIGIEFSTRTSTEGSEQSSRSGSQTSGVSPGARVSPGTGSGGGGDYFDGVPEVTGR